jgi:hypothetical protein
VKHLQTDPPLRRARPRGSVVYRHVAEKRRRAWALGPRLACSHPRNLALELPNAVNLSRRVLGYKPNLGFGSATDARVATDPIVPAMIERVHRDAMPTMNGDHIRNGPSKNRAPGPNLEVAVHLPRRESCALLGLIGADADDANRVAPLLVLQRVMVGSEWLEFQYAGTPAPLPWRKATMLPDRRLVPAGVPHDVDRPDLAPQQVQVRVRLRCLPPRVRKHHAEVNAGLPQRKRSGGAVLATTDAHDAQQFAVANAIRHVDALHSHNLVQSSPMPKKAESATVALRCAPTGSRQRGVWVA